MMTMHGAKAHKLQSETESDAERLENKPSFRRFARVGLGARSVIYGVLTFLCIGLAWHGSAPAPADGEGAIEELAHQPAGPFLLVLLSIGLLAYASWRVTHAAAPMNAKSGTTAARRIGLAASGALYLFLCAQAVALLLNHHSTRSGGGAAARPIAASILRWPVGGVLLGVVGAGIISAGLALAIWGAVHNYSDVFARSSMPNHVFGLTHVAGVAGDVTRGLVVALVGAYVMKAAVEDRPSQVRGLDSALQSLTREPGAVELLAVVAAGMLAFALYSACEAAYRRV